MPAYDPSDHIWTELYITFSRFESALQTTAIHIQWLTVVLTAAGIVCLTVFLLSRTYKHSSNSINRSLPRVAIRTILVLSVMASLSGAHQGIPANLPGAVLSDTPEGLWRSQSKIWHLRQGADGDGTSAAHPTGSTAELEGVSGPGDVILLHPAGAPLDGGLALKPGQALIGILEDGRKPAITNTDSTRHEGAGVVAAEDSRIWNVRIEDTHASGILGVDVSSVSIDEVEVERANQSGSFTTSEMNPLGSIPHGGIVFIQSDSAHTGANRIVRSAVIDAAGMGIASFASGAAKSRLVVSDSRVEGGIPVARFDMGIAVNAQGPSSELHLELTGTTVRGRMGRGGRNVIVLANSDATATARIERSHLAEVGQDGVIGVALQVPATVKLDIRDTIIEKAGQTNLEGTILNLPPFDTSRVAETLMSINVEDSIIRDAGTAAYFEQDDIGAGNIWIGSSAMAQQMSPGSNAPFQPGRFWLGVRNSKVEGSSDFAIGVGNIGSNWGIAPEVGTFEVELRDNTIAVDGPAEILIAAPEASIDARQNCWGRPEGISADRVRLLESAEHSQLDASEPLGCETAASTIP